MRDWLYSYCCGAGRGARAKYREGSGRWRKRVFRHPRLILAVFAGATWLAWVLAGQSHWPLALGFLLGALLTGYIAILESPPAHIENWRTGAEGERRTARALAPLRRRGYVLLHDLSDRHTNEHNRRGNIDHVVVCSGGVFLLDSKYLGGEVSIDGDNVHLQRRDNDDDSYDLPGLARAMRGRAIRLQEDIVAKAGVTFVQPVVVFWNPFEAGVVTGKTVVFVHGERLGGWLEGQRAKMTPDVVVLVGDTIAAARPAAHRGWHSQLPRLVIPGRGTPVTGS